MTSSPDRFCSQASLERIRQSLQGTASGTKGMCFLVLSGSFNPVHRQHLNILSLSRNHFRNLGWSVIAGFLAPSTDEYVRSKLGADAMSLDRRIQLCELAVREELGWADVCHKAEAHGTVACRTLENEIDTFCSAVSTNHKIVGIEVMGSDTVQRVFHRRLADKVRGPSAGEIVCCILRPDTKDREQGSTIEAIKRSAYQLGVDVVFAEGITETSAGSTAIRKLLAGRDWDGLEAMKLLSPSVLGALRTQLS
jgi:nicotinic acid mononucleotide adenylyltransferase